MNSVIVRRETARRETARRETATATRITVVAAAVGAMTAIVLAVDVEAGVGATTVRAVTTARRMVDVPRAKTAIRSPRVTANLAMTPITISPPPMVRPRK